MPTCPVCHAQKAKESYLPPTSFNKKKFNYMRCCKCNAIFVSPFPDQSDYEKMYPINYQGNISQENTFNRDINGLVTLINKYSNGKNILDYGCGNGSFLHQMSKLGFQCTGVELNILLIESLQKTFPRTNFMDTEQFKEDKKLFDVIFISNVLEHMTEPNNLLLLLKSKLTKEGILIVQGPIEDNFHFSLLIRKIYFSIKKKLGYISSHPPTHIFQLSIANQLKMLEQNGFTKIDMKIDEQAWPFPASISEAKGIIGLLMHITAQMSLFLKRINKQWGNMFIYIGKSI